MIALQLNIVPHGMGLDRGKYSVEQLRSKSGQVTCSQLGRVEQFHDLVQTCGASMHGKTPTAVLKHPQTFNKKMPKKP
jgi:hypothetical protein